MRVLATCLALTGAVFLSGQAHAQNAFDAAAEAYERGDYASAAALYDHACTGGNAEGCTELGMLYDQGAGVTKDETRAAGLYRRACIAGNAKGCSNLGVDYANGLGVTKDDTHAAVLYQKACKSGYVVGCIGLGDFYRDGRGVKKDKARALQLYRRALTLDPFPKLTEIIRAKINDLATAPMRKVAKRKRKN